MARSTRAERPELTTITAAATRLKVHPRTVRRMIERGEITAYRVGTARAVRLRSDDVERALTPITPDGQ